ncbi:MAG: GNAT family N-acetyltransferase [Phycisphaeraceae bacterium]|nr:GNAT family N-acetyltransferase [Phycisphaeraceae bacterium]
MPTWRAEGGLGSCVVSVSALAPALGGANRGSPAIERVVCAREQHEVRVVHLAVVVQVRRAARSHVHVRAQQQVVRAREQNEIGGVYCATAGFKGPPVDGMLELGYSVVPSHHRRGIATEIVQLLISSASHQFQISCFCAHTLAGDPASSGVLRKNGFVSAGTVIDPEDGALRDSSGRGEQQGLMCGAGGASA